MRTTTVTVWTNLVDNRGKRNYERAQSKPRDVHGVIMVLRDLYATWRDCVLPSA